MPNNSVSDILSARVSLMLSSSVFYSAFYFLEINIQYNVVLPAAILLKANYIDVTLPHYACNRRPREISEQNIRKFINLSAKNGL